MNEAQAERLAHKLYMERVDGKPSNTPENRARFGLMLEALFKRHGVPPADLLRSLKQGRGFIRACTTHALQEGVPEQEIRALYAFCFT